MGYTHYWRSPKGFAFDKWQAFTVDAGKILRNLPEGIVQREYDDPTPPTCNENEVRFNGIGDDGHETFLMDSEPRDIGFCKTARKPYDVVVCAVLIAAKHHFGSAIKVSSDGGWNDPDEWVPARNLYKLATGREPPAKVLS